MNSTVSYTVQPFAEADASEWDRFLENSPMGTFLHSRRYLSYHGERFQDQSLMVRDLQKNIVALFPAAVHPFFPDVICSHPGISYGGLLHQGKLLGIKIIEVLSAIRDYYGQAGYLKLQYKAVPHIYHHGPVEDDLYALFSLGAVPYQCDLTSTLDVRIPRPISKRRQRSLRKAQKTSLEIREGLDLLPSLWPVVVENLQRKHNIEPVHSYDEMQELCNRFPENIRIVSALLEGEVIAGMILYITKTVVHSQYSASSPIGNRLSALDPVVQYCLSLAKDIDRWYFDFGISTEKDKKILNSGLYDFKSEFGGGGVIHMIYELTLSIRD